MNVPPHIQYLRCLANYEALKFSLPVAALAKELVNRMIKKSSRTGGKYVSVHLRFEEVIILVFHTKRLTKFKFYVINYLFLIGHGGLFMLLV